MLNRRLNGVAPRRPGAPDSVSKSAAQRRRQFFREFLYIYTDRGGMAFIKGSRQKIELEFDCGRCHGIREPGNLLGALRPPHHRSLHAEVSPGNRDLPPRQNPRRAPGRCLGGPPK